MNEIHTEKTDRPIFKASGETEKLIQRLKNSTPGEVITWAEMHLVTGIPELDKPKLRSALTTARRHLLNEDQACFAAVLSVGIKRLPAGEVVAQESTTAVKVRRTVKASMRRLSTVNPESLPPQQATQHRMTSAALGAIALCVKPSSLSKVQQATIMNGAIDSKAALELFTK